MLIGYIASGPNGPSQAQDVGYQLHLDGIEMIDDGQWEEARSTYTRIIEEFPPEDPNALGRVHLNRAIALYELGLYEEALADETIVIDLAPSDTDLLAHAYLNRSREHSYLDMDNEAVGDATAVINLEPEDTNYLARAYANRGITMRERGNLGDAVADWTAALQLDPEADLHVALLVYRAEVYGAMGRNDEAIDDATNAIDASTAVSADSIDGTRVTTSELLARAHITRGATLGQAGQSEDALKDLTSAIELAPQDNYRLATAHLMRAMVYYDLYRDAEAGADLQRVTILVPPDDELHRMAIEMTTDISESA
jgi:tetratricopeptide (TPR) repeat protein